MITELNNCRICKGTKLDTIIDLGIIFPSGFIKEYEDPPESSKAPLVLCRCLDCGLVQLKHTVELDLMYRQYWYSSSLNKSMIESLKDVVTDIQNRMNIKTRDVILDIGCNDGTMLNMFPSTSIKVGFDPALNLHKPTCDKFLNDYFSADAYSKVLNQKAKVISAIAMFYDLPDPNAFVNDVVSILDEAGIFVIQYTDLCSMLKVNAVDNICHEHLEYYSFEVVKNLLESHGLEVIDVSHNDVNGASIRVTAAFPGKYLKSIAVDKEIKEERLFLVKKTFDAFSNNIEITKRKITGFLKWAKQQNKRVYIMGASTKGNTLLQICGVTDKDCEYASEVNPDKFGLKTVGSNVKIISEEEALIKHPDYFVVLPWHFKKSLTSKKNIQDYIHSGGRLIFPLPDFSVVALTYEGIGEFQL